MVKYNHENTKRNITGTAQNKLFFTISDAALNDLVRRVLDEVSERSINDSAHF